MSRVREIVDGIFRRGTRFYKGLGVSFGGWQLSCFPFAETIYQNCIGLLTDLGNDVTWKFGKGQESLAAAFIRFYNRSNKIVWQRVYDNGYCVIAHQYIGEGASRADAFRLARETEYHKENNKDIVTIVPNRSAEDAGVEFYAMVSSLYETTGKSHRELSLPFRSYLDNALNASNTITERLGAFVVGSPKGSVNTYGRLNKEEKEEIEAEIRKDYGALSQQSQFLLLPKEMDMQVVSLASLDLKTDFRVRTAVLAMADLFRIPANQIAMIDASSSKALSNGSELLAGDLAKYKSFERLLEETFVRLAIDLGLAPGGVEMIDGVETPIYYGIYNKPKLKQDEGVS